MRHFCQVVTIALWVIGFFYSLYVQIEGRHAEQPSGFGGVIWVFATQILICFTQWEAGVYEAFH